MSLKKTHFEYIAEVSQKNPNIEVIGIYNGNKEKILHKCKVCGYEWEIKPIHIIQGHGCPQCAKIQRAKSKTMNHETFVKRVAQLYPNIRVLGEYINTHNPIEVQCTVCGYKWKPKAAQLLIDGNGGTGCKQCYTQLQTKSTSVFKEELLQKNPYVKLIGDYYNSYTKTTFKCIACDKKCIWKTTPKIVLDGGKSPICLSSNGVIKIEKYLQTKNIVYCREKTFNDCKNVKCLPFDFYLPQYNICIEYDGRQHYQPVNFNGCSNEKALDSFQKNQINDNIKNQYCKLKNINLLRISYLDEDVIDDILDKFLFNILKGGDAK